MSQGMKADRDYECEEEGFVCECCERIVRPACAGLVPGLEFLADMGSGGRLNQQVRPRSALQVKDRLPDP